MLLGYDRNNMPLPSPVPRGVFASLNCNRLQWRSSVEVSALITSDLLPDKGAKGSTPERLGRNYEDVRAIINDHLFRGVAIKTINQSVTFMKIGKDLEDMVTDVMLTFLKGIAAAERDNRLASVEAGR